MDDLLRMQIINKVQQIVNSPGLTWKERRALLRQMRDNNPHILDLNEQVIARLIPEPPEGMEFHPSDY